MGNDTTPSDGETPPSASPAGETPTPQGTGETPGTTTPSLDDLQTQVRDLQAALKKANAESASHRHKAKELDELKAKLETEKLSETEKLQKQYADLKTQHDEFTRATFERVVNAEIRAQAAALGVNPKHLDKVVRFVEWEDIEPDADGNPTGIKEAVEKLTKEMPELVGKPALASGGATNPPRSHTSGQQEITDAYIAQLTPTQYNELSPDMKLRVSQYMQSRVNTRRR